MGASPIEFILGYSFLLCLIVSYFSYNQTMTDSDAIQTYHLKISFSQYEKSFLMEHLTQYLKTIQRHLPKQNFPQDIPFMTSDHCLLQFESTQTSLIPAYELFLLDVQFWHTFQPSQLCFTAKMSNSNLFPNAYGLLHESQTDLTQDTLLALNTPSGTYPVASHLPPHQIKPILVYQLSLNIHLEQLQYSLSPYNEWFQIETEGGHLNFPTEPTVNFSQLPPIQNEHFPPMKLPPLPRSVHFNNRRSNQNNHQSYDPYQQQLQDIRDRQTQLFQLVHQQQQPPLPYTQPPPVPSHHLPDQPTTAPVIENQNPIPAPNLSNASAPSFPPNGAPPNVPSLADQLESLTVTWNQIEAQRPPHGVRGASATHTPRHVTVGRGRGTPRSHPPLPTGFTSPHTPSQAPTLASFRLQNRPLNHSSPRHRLQSTSNHPGTSSLISGSPSSHVTSDSIPSYRPTPAQVVDLWQQSGEDNIFQDNRPPPTHESDNLDPNLSSNPQHPPSVPEPGSVPVTNDPNVSATVTNDQNVSVPTTTDPTVSVQVPIHIPNTTVSQALASNEMQNPDNIQSIVNVSVQNSNGDELRNLDVHKRDSENLNKLAEILKDFPTNNQFRDYAYPDPSNKDFKCYTLPDYLKMYVTHLLLRMNASNSNLHPLLSPYIQTEPTLNRLITFEANLDLITLQKLDFLLNKDKEPTFLTKLATKVTKKRNKSKD